MDTVKHGAIGDGVFQNEGILEIVWGFWDIGGRWEELCLNDSERIDQLRKTLHPGYAQLVYLSAARSRGGMGGAN